MAVFSKRYRWAWGVAVVVTALFALVNMTPHHETFLTVHHLKRAMTLVFGGFYFGAQWLIALSPFLLIVVFGVTFALWMGISTLWKQRRWPSLVMVMIALVVNWIFIGAPGIVLSPYIPGEMEECEYLFDANARFRIRRFPVDVGLEYAEQTFYLVSHDGGESWRQLYGAYAAIPSLYGCDNIRRNGQDGILIYMERRIARDTNDLLVLESVDRGFTWIMQNDRPVE
jgi:hypothetical protein